MIADTVDVFDAASFARKRLGFHPDAMQRKFLQVTPRRGILCCTRQWGKTTAAAVKALHTAWAREKALVIVASPSGRQSSIVLRKVRSFVRELGIKPRGDGDNPISVELPNGSRIVGLPGGEATTRGFSSPDLLLIDEASRVQDAAYDALLPMLSTGRGALWLLSTPKGKNGFFWREWQNGGEKWVRIQVPATECDRIPAEWLEEERRRKTAHMFRQEYFCEFLDIEGALFREEDIFACVDSSLPVLFRADVHPPNRLRRHPRFYVGVDLGQMQDYTAVVVVERNEVVGTERDKYSYQFPIANEFYLRYAERVPLGTSYTQIADEVRVLVNRPPLAGRTDVIVDGTGVGAAVVDLLKKGRLGCRVMPVSITSGLTENNDGRWHHVPKKTLIGGLQTGFERRQLRVARGIGAFEDLIEELRGMRMRRRGGSFEEYSGGHHDDLVLALSLAWWRARSEGAR